ncbi:MAG: nucleotide pyrophosphohydrolase [Candidatus Izemoplasma sp.]|nr:nucleotide pyrophosphohydrolase [Candidatus Izemoplasma sp.]
MKEINELLQKLKQFREERDWKQFHTPENLTKSIVIEATELLENYQWGNEHADIDNVKDEVADIFGYLLLLCHDLDIDLIKETHRKIEDNKKKYPVSKAYGSSKKYTKL